MVVDDLTILCTSSLRLTLPSQQSLQTTAPAKRSTQQYKNSPFFHRMSIILLSELCISNVPTCILRPATSPNYLESNRSLQGTLVEPNPRGRWKHDLIKPEDIRNCPEKSICSMAGDIIYVAKGSNTVSKLISSCFTGQKRCPVAHWGPTITPEH